MASQAVLELLVQMKDEASSGLSSIGSAIGTLGGIAGGVALAGVTAFGAAVVSGIGDAREAAQVMAQTEAVIKSTGGAAGFTADQIADMAGQLSAASGKSLFGDSDIQKGQNLLLTFTNIKETLPDATQTMIDMAQALGTDVAGGAVQLGKALNDPIAGISALSRVGVTFTEEQKAQIAAMQEAGDTAGAQRLILAELNKEFGGSAQAAADADGGWAQLNDRWGEAKEALGAAVLPLLGMLVGVLNDQVMPAIEQGAAIFGVLVAAAQEAIPPVVAMFTDMLGPTLTENAGWFQTTFAQIQEIVQGVVGIVMTLLGQLGNFIQNHSTEIKLVLSAAWAIIQSTITAALALINGVIQTALALIRGDWQGAWDAIKTMSATVVQALFGVIKGGLDLIAGIFGTSIDGILKTWRGAGAQLIDIGRNMIDGFRKGISDAWSGIESWLHDLAMSLPEWFREWWGIKSPSKVMAGIGGFVVGGLVMGMEGMIPALLSTIDQVGITMINGLKKKTPQAIAEVERIVADLTKQAKSIGSQINDAIASGFEGEASIDRLLADNLDAITKFTGKLGMDVRNQLDDALRVASQFADPKQASEFYKLRSDQILELADLQDQLNQDLSKEDRARIEQQMALIKAAQEAEQKAFGAENAGKQGPIAELTAQLQALLGNANLPSILDSPVISSLNAMLNQLTNAGAAFATPTGSLAAAGPVNNRPDAPINYHVTIAVPPGTTTQQATGLARELGNLAKSRRA